MRTIIIHGPPGCGKSEHAEALRLFFGSESIVEKWSPGMSLKPNALHLTSDGMRAHPGRYGDAGGNLADVFCYFDAMRRFDMHQAAHTKGSVPQDKPTNPKDAVGIRKWRQIATIPFTVMTEVGVALFEGARKYGRHNYRVAGVRASVYVDAAMGHIGQWWEGEDKDPDTGLSHITKAIASLVVLRDAMIQDMLTDDRPPPANLDAVRDDLQKVVDAMFERHPEPVPAFTAKDAA